MVTPAQRRTQTKKFAWITLAGIPAFVFCGLSHICMDGHMRHPPYPWWHFAIDLQWVVFFVTAAIHVRQSELRRPRLSFWFLVLLVVFRLPFGSLGGGFLILFDLPVLIYLAAVAFRTLWRRRDRSSIIADPAQQII